VRSLFGKTDQPNKEEKIMINYIDKRRDVYTSLSSEFFRVLLEHPSPADTLLQDALRSILIRAFEEGRTIGQEEVFHAMNQVARRFHIRQNQKTPSPPPEKIPFYG
jgi:hypothetical protein